MQQATPIQIARSDVLEARREIARFSNLLEMDIIGGNTHAASHHQTMLEIWREREQQRSAVLVDLLLKVPESWS